MEITAVAEGVVAALIPFLPLLRRIGEGAAEHAVDEIGARIDAKGWELAKALWARIRHQVAGDRALEQATGDLAALPADPAAREALQQQLHRVLNTDPVLLTDLRQLLDATAATQQTNVASEVNIGVQAGRIGGGKVQGIGKQSGASRAEDR
jgi:hypothetical protein